MVESSEARAVTVRGRRVLGSVIAATLLGSLLLLTVGRPSIRTTETVADTTVQAETGKTDGNGQPNDQATTVLYLDPIDATVQRSTSCSTQQQELVDESSAHQTCQLVQIELTSGAAEGELYELAPLYTNQDGLNSLESGDEVSVRPVWRNAELSYEFVGQNRSGMLVVIAAACLAGIIIAWQGHGIRLVALGATAIAVLHWYALPAIVGQGGVTNLPVIAAVSATLILAAVLLMDGPLRLANQVAFLAGVIAVLAMLLIGQILSTAASLGSPVTAATLSLNPLNIEPTAQAYLLLSLTVGAAFVAASIAGNHTRFILTERTANQHLADNTIAAAALTANRARGANAIGIYALASAAASLPVLALFDSTSMSASQALNNELVASTLVRITAGIIGLGLVGPIAASLMALMLPMAEPAADPVDRTGQIHEPRPSLRRDPEIVLDLTEAPEANQRDEPVHLSVKDGSPKASFATTLASRIRVGIEED